MGSGASKSSANTGAPKSAAGAKPTSGPSAANVSASSGGGGAGGAAGGAKLFLNFDVNKTIVMLDSSTGSSTADLMCRVLSETCWGTIVQAPAPTAGAAADAQAASGGGEVAESTAWTWSLLSEEPSLIAPAGARVGNPAQGLKKGDAVTYSDFLEHGRFVQSKALSREENEAIKKARRQAKMSFATKGQPGDIFSPYVEELCGKLRIPEDKREACKASGIAALATGENYFIIPALFHTLSALADAGRDVSVCFRTFGHDHHHLVEEFNAFCSGTHPLYPGVRLDGTGPSGLDLRVATADNGDGNGARLLDVACFERTGPEKGDTTLHVGVDDVAKKDSAREHVAGFEAVNAFFVARCARPGSMLVRDHYKYWASQAEDSFAGKLHLVDRADASLHRIFFDDNVEPTYAHIVDARDTVTGERLPFDVANNCWYSKAEPLHAIADPSYFLKLIGESEANISRRHQEQSEENSAPGGAGAAP